MNRQTILASIDRHLRESFAETGEVRPLGEIVARVANEIRSGSGSVVVTTPGVIPIEKVAAFVDGQVESSEADLICEAVMVDNSVLAEIVAAIRATHVSVEQLPPLPASLSARLLAMNSTTRESVDAEDGSVDDTRLSEIMVQPTTKLAQGRSRIRRRERLQIAAGLLAIAATILTAIILLGRQGNEAPDQTMIVDNDAVPPQLPSLPSTLPDVDPDPENQAPEEPIQGIAGNDTPAPRPANDIPEPSAAEPEPTATMTPDAEAVVRDGSTEAMPIPPPEINPLLDPDPVRTVAAAPGLTDVRWTEVSGLLVQRNELSEQSGSARAITWRRIPEGPPSTSSSSPADKVALRTLPFSRANGELATGGKIVIAGDTGLQITRGVDEASAELNLMYGSVAMVNLAEGTTIKLQHGDQTFVTLRWQGKASAVVHRQTTGLQIQVDGGQLEVNEQRVKEGLIRVANDQTIETAGAPKRLPRWITRPDESTAADRMILAQIADSTDLTRTLNEKINVLASSQRLSRDEALVLAKLANWQAAMTGPNLFRLAGSRVPALRLAALQRLAQLPESDPRYERAWTTAGRAVKNAQRIAQIQGWFRMLRNGARPNPAQLEEMLTGLSTRDLAGRALSDFMLRQYIRNPPPFDPSWTGQTLQRTVNVYRDRAGIPADRVRPNAAAAGVR